MDNQELGKHNFGIYKFNSFIIFLVLIYRLI